ncbi:MAG: TonB-dependent receptor [Gemmatimonadaceae bacterium]
MNHSISFALCASCTGLVLAFAGQVRAQTTAPTRLDSATIVASRAQVGAAGRTVDVITRNDISQSPARNLAELLGARLSIDAFTRSPAQADVSIRGATAEQVLILVDGVRMGDAQSAHYALDLGIPLSAIERIEILRGPGSALYGPNAIGGVINIVTRGGSGSGDSVPAGETASLYGGTFGTVGLGASDRGSIGATSLSSDLQFDKSDGHRPDTDYRIFQARLGADRTVGNSGTLTTAASMGVRDFGAANFYSPYPSGERTGTTTGEARWAEPMGRWALNVGASTRLHTDRFDLVRDDPAVYENRHRSWQTGAEATARTETIGNTSFVIGGSAEHDQLSSARLGGRREWRAAAFMEQAIPVSTRVQIVAGERDDHASTYGDFFSPSLALSAVATSELTLRASVARGFRAPTWTERYYVDPGNSGNPLVQPEKFANGEVGATYAPVAASGIGLKLDAAVFTRHAKDLIDWVRPVNRTDLPWQIANVGTAAFRGIETTLSASPVPGMTVSFGASGTAFDDGDASGLTGKYALQPITRELTASTTIPLPSHMTISLDAVHARRAGEAGYTTGSTRLSWNVQRIRIFVDGTNLANASWLDASGDIAQGRALFVGFGWHN